MWDGKRKQLYLNGIHVGTTEPPPFTVDKPAPIALGVCADTTGKPKANFLKGRIQCVRITKGIRFTTDFELESALPMRKDSDTLCLLDFEEGEGDVAKDLSGNGHDGQIHGANWKRMWPCPVEEKKLREVEEALRKANSGADHLRLRASGFPGGMHLSVGAPGPEMKKIHDIRSLSGLPIRSLTLSATGVSDITPLAGMSLVVLFMRDTPVSDLSAIKGCPLVVLDAKGTKISDLDPLRGMPLRFLHLLYCRGVKNLEPLSGMPLQHLCVTGASVTDISVLAGMPLRSLGPSDNTMDFTPLASCPSLELVPPWTIPEDQLAFIKKSLPKTAFSLDIALWNGVVYGRVLPDIMADLLRGLPDAGKHSDSSTPRNDLAAFLLVGEYSKAAAIADGDDSLAAAVCAMPQRILDSFRADVGKTGEIRLKKETLTCEIREVNGDAISVFEVVKRGNTTGKIGRTIRYDELSVQEKLRRLGSGDNPELNIMRGLLAAEAERPDIARKLFEKTDGPLAEALIAELHKQEVEGADAAADRAGRDLLRTIARSTAATSRDSIIAEIRAKCEASPGNVNQARKLLAAYEEDYGETEAGKRWISVVRDALTYPWPGEDWTVPDLGMEFVWIEPMNMWVGKYEVTNGEYRKFRPRHNTGMAPASCSLNADRQPVANVRQPEAETFAALLDTCEGEAGRRPEGCGYRLPTSREFLHYVACGDKVPKYPWGNTWPPERTNLAGAEAAETKNNHLVRTIDGYRDEFPVSAPVDRTEPNAWGICGLAGNVAEWMAREKNTARCMYRGACWASGFRKKGEGDLRTGDLYCPAEETYRAQTIGFRLVLAPALGGDK
jgi:formylglycine-generating enzyme required for sulfatase activity